MVPNFEKPPSQEQKSVAQIFNEKIRAGNMRAFEDKNNGEVTTWTPDETDEHNKHLLSILSDRNEYREVTNLIKKNLAEIEEKADGKMLLRYLEKKQIEKVRQFE